MQVGLSEHDNYHEFCRLLGRLKTNYQLSELVSSFFVCHECTGSTVNLNIPGGLLTIDYHHKATQNYFSRLNIFKIPES